ncbi:MAG: arylesterase [Colwellia polaris]|jgi:acyl-CoA thioesterase-1|uniref:arylesterase n=1 Tax=Colwellia polaris TaxID=326537 RepID=UPI000A1700AC|nr:arylesterase [Colwellia polaris]|tara:strand:+ start:7366 stop:8040 length:675 start_codon:yes stop_codon:yes gene_type:complete
MKNYPLYLLFISLLFITSTNVTAQGNKTNTIDNSIRITPTSNILLLGDSISASYGMKPTQGWVHLLNEKLNEQNQPYTIINASVSGETTSGGLSRLAGILANQDVDHLLIELGGNDGLRGYSPKLIKNNLLQMVKLAQDKNIKVSMIQIKITPNYGPRYNKMFEQVFEDVAKASNITLLPFFMEAVATDKSLMQADGIHPNAEAQPIIANYVEQQLNNLMTMEQ